MAGMKSIGPDHQAMAKIDYNKCDWGKTITIHTLQIMACLYLAVQLPFIVQAFK